MLYDPVLPPASSRRDDPEVLINETAPKADKRVLAFALKRPLLAFSVWLVTFTGVVTSAVWLPRDGAWALIAVLATACVTGAAVRWRRRRRARSAGV
ncbi:hypothetical protein [Streptacidiphilus rugosus]|uniref:hypothetical protein n=1 Tax=Streptacidiphilus rugosus TaxID=405783 RepID=UPI000562EC5A|nr:hypothetical protein [Streptacidiphilus rugosus]